MKTGPLTPLGSIKGDTWERIYDHEVVIGDGSLASTFPIQTSDYVKATNSYDGNHIPSNATNPTKSLSGEASGNAWATPNGVVGSQRFHIDLLIPRIVTKVYYENYHVSGGVLDRGAKNFTFWGSNSASAFAELTYGINTNWTQITTDVSQLEPHSAINGSDPKYINVTNTMAYRYYAFKFADNWGSGTLMGVRRIELQAVVLSSLTISGLNGDVDEEYILESKVVNGYNGSIEVKVRLNNDTTATAYGYQVFYGENSTVIAGRDTSEAQLHFLNAVALSQVTAGEMKIFAKSGFVRTTLLENTGSISGTTVTAVGLLGQSWNNTADNITSLVIEASQTGGIGVGSQFTLWKKSRRAV